MEVLGTLEMNQCHLFHMHAHVPLSLRRAKSCTATLYVLNPCSKAKVAYRSWVTSINRSQSSDPSHS